MAQTVRVVGAELDTAHHPFWLHKAKVKKNKLYVCNLLNTLIFDLLKIQ